MRRVFFLLAALAFVASAGYFTAGYVIYDSLSDISGRCQGEVRNNSPASFTLEEVDTTPYLIADYEEVSFPSREAGIDIVGWYAEAEPQGPTVLLVHGLGSCRYSETVLLPAGMLARAGFNILMVDVRDSGDSTQEDGRSAIGNEEYLDVLGAYDWLVDVKGIPADQVGILGNSLGAATSLIAFAQEPQLAAVFVDSPFDNLPQIIEEELARNNYPGFLYWGGVWMASLVAGDDVLAYNPSDALRQSNGRPLYIIHGTADSRIGVHHSYQLQEQAQQLGVNAQFWFPEDIEHVRASRDAYADYETTLVTFFSDTLR